MELYEPWGQVLENLYISFGNQDLMYNWRVD